MLHDFVDVGCIFQVFKYLSARHNGKEGTYVFQPVSESTEADGSGYNFVRVKV